LALVVGQAMAMAAAGVAIGVLLALWGGKILSAMLFGVGPRDPLVLGAASVFLLAVAFAAALAAGAARDADRPDDRDAGGLALANSAHTLQELPTMLWFTSSRDAGFECNGLHAGPCFIAPTCLQRTALARMGSDGPANIAANMGSSSPLEQQVSERCGRRAKRRSRATHNQEIPRPARAGKLHSHRSPIASQYRVTRHDRNSEPRGHRLTNRLGASQFHCRRERHPEPREIALGHTARARAFLAGDIPFGGNRGRPHRPAPRERMAAGRSSPARLVPTAPPPGRGRAAPHQSLPTSICPADTQRSISRVSLICKLKVIPGWTAWNRPECGGKR